MLSRETGVKYGVTQGNLIISAAPVGAQAVVNQRLIEAGAINVAGVYECEFATDGMNTIEAELKPSAVTGTFKPYLRVYRFNRASFRAADEAAGANFVAGTTEVLTLTNLLGKAVAKVVFTIPGGGSVTFAVGADQTAPGAIAEYNGL